MIRRGGPFTRAADRFLVVHGSKDQAMKAPYRQAPGAVISLCAINISFETADSSFVSAICSLEQKFIQVMLRG